jgi:prepilin peptidase CpaA
MLDIRERRLPNWLCAVLAVAGTAGLAATAGPAAVPWALLHAVLALIAGMVLFRLGVIGGGDAKFYAAAACALPLDRALPLLGWTSAAGLCLLLVMTVRRRIAGVTPEGTRFLRGWEVPYGVAIAAGFALTLLWN